MSGNDGASFPKAKLSLGRNCPQLWSQRHPRFKQQDGGDADFVGPAESSERILFTSSISSSSMRYVDQESRAGSRDLRRAVFPLARINDCKSGKDSCQRPQLSSPQATTQSFLTVTMNSLRVARAALRARPTAMRVAIQRRGYAEAVPDKVRLLRMLQC